MGIRTCRALCEAVDVQVLKEDYGLSTSDILSLADKDLNQLVGLKKYAPYKAETSQKRLRRDTLHKLSNFKKSSAQVHILHLYSRFWNSFWLYLPWI